ncbi:MAG TPA: N-acetyl-gamma-glutamyl-phosphate reductase, partial [Candidatus Dormibacteraeota bacterium]|nr:N-acetyl-gamma-glutamyl-phosphate reductase [Candidatus Dormibacteraeota bacterium]
ADSVDVVFAALPHGVAAAHARGWLSRGAAVIDMSADFRLADPAQYRAWYGVDHPAPDLCDEAVYALVELHRDQLRSANLIAVPGCYPTAALLAVAPALRSGLIDNEVVVDAKSGVSGAGRSASLGTHFAEVNESVHAYAVEGHRHKPEMLAQLQALGGEAVSLTFVPHLIPMTRGILATAYLRPAHAVAAAQVVETYQAFAAENVFVRWSDRPPATKVVSGTNFAAMHAAMQDEVVVVTVAIDNLVKGAAGQAVQAMNVRHGFDETLGLERWPLWP